MANAKTNQPAKRDLHEVSVQERFSTSDLREVKNVDDALKLITDAFGGIQSIGEFELGSGFKLLGDDEKKRLVKVPLILLFWQFNEGDFGEFVSVTLITADKNADRLILNDGSSGICEQLRDISENTGRYGGITIPNGLRVSEYDTCLGCGKPRKPSVATCDCTDTNAKRGKGSTYYLDVND